MDKITKGGGNLTEPSNVIYPPLLSQSQTMVPGRFWSCQSVVKKADSISATALLEFLALRLEYLHRIQLHWLVYPLYMLILSHTLHKKLAGVVVLFVSKMVLHFNFLRLISRSPPANSMQLQLPIWPTYLSLSLITPLVLWKPSNDSLFKINYLSVIFLRSWPVWLQNGKFHRDCPFGHHWKATYC